MILKAVHGTSTPPDIIDLRTGLALIHDTVCQCSDGGADTHIWTSPRMMKTQLNTIRDALVAAFPSQKQGIEARYGGLVQRIDSSIAYADEKLKGSSGKIIVISHGAYDYLCHDYGIIQRAIEVGGKEAATRSLYALINEAKERGVKTVFPSSNTLKGGSKE